MNEFLGSARFLPVVVGLLLSQAALPRAGYAAEPEVIRLPGISGWVLAPDNQTLIVSTGSGGELIYVDTVANRKTKSVEVDFQPTALTLQGDELIAANKGAAQLRVLDWATGKEKKTIQLSGAPVKSLACHPAKGYVYAACDDEVIFAANPKSGQAWRTQGRGAMLAVAPVDGSALYAGTQRNIRDELRVQNQGRQTRVRVVQAGQFATLSKFRVEGKELRQAGVNSRAVVNASKVVASPDGKRVAIVGGGGLVSPTDGRRSYSIPCYRADDIKTMDGQIELGAYPMNIAFHPVLSIGVADRSGELTLFKSKSLAKIKVIGSKREASAPGESILLAFGGGGKKILYGKLTGGGDQASTNLYLIPLELSAEQESQLKKSS